MTCYAAQGSTLPTLLADVNFAHCHAPPQAAYVTLSRSSGWANLVVLRSFDIKHLLGRDDDELNMENWRIGELELNSMTKWSNDGLFDDDPLDDLLLASVERESVKRSRAAQSRPLLGSSRVLRSAGKRHREGDLAADTGAGEHLPKRLRTENGPVPGPVAPPVPPPAPTQVLPLRIFDARQQPVRSVIVLLPCLQQTPLFHGMHCGYYACFHAAAVRAMLPALREAMTALLSPARARGAALNVAWPGGSRAPCDARATFTPQLAKWADQLAREDDELVAASLLPLAVPRQRCPRTADVRRSPTNLSDAQIVRLLPDVPIFSSIAATRTVLISGDTDNYLALAADMFARDGCTIAILNTTRAWDQGLHWIAVAVMRLAAYDAVFVLDSMNNAREEHKLLEPLTPTSPSAVRVAADFRLLLRQAQAIQPASAILSHLRAAVRALGFLDPTSSDCLSAWAGICSRVLALSSEPCLGVSIDLSIQATVRANWAGKCDLLLASIPAAPAGKLPLVTDATAEQLRAVLPEQTRTLLVNTLLLPHIRSSLASCTSALAAFHFAPAATASAAAIRALLDALLAELRPQATVALRQAVSTLIATVLRLCLDQAVP